MPDTMTAAQLIAALQAFPPETPIYRHDYEYGPEPVESVQADPYTDGKVTIS